MTEEAWALSKNEKAQLALIFAGLGLVTALVIGILLAMSGDVSYRECKVLPDTRLECEERRGNYLQAEGLSTVPRFYFPVPFTVAGLMLSLPAFRVHPSGSGG